MVTAAVLVVAALCGGWWASTVMMVVGSVFLDQSAAGETVEFGLEGPVSMA